MKYYHRERRLPRRSLRVLRPPRRLDMTGPLGHPCLVAQRDPKSPLARAIKDRRAELQLTQEEFASRGGLKLKTLQRAEGGSKPHPKTLGGIDIAAEWPLGRARQIQDGQIEYPAVALTDDERLEREAREQLRLLKRRLPYPLFVRVVAEVLTPPEESDTHSGGSSDFG